METIYAFVVGGLFAAGLYLVLRRSMVKLLLGLAIITNAVNLLIFTAAGLTADRPPLVQAGADAPPTPYADPLPQAFILTAIVIGFGVLSFAVVLVLKAYQALGADDLDRMRSTE
jgi:multicomponent Na+:H+ antiporter subunit C